MDRFLSHFAVYTVFSCTFTTALILGMEARGAAIGHKKIDRIETVSVSKVRIRVLKAAEPPIFRKFAVYCTAQ